MLLPTRRADLLVRSVGSDVVVYDERTKSAHSLDATTGLVLSACDGETTYAQAWVRHGLSQPVIDGAVAQLSEAGLLAGTGGLSRRTLLTRTAVVGGSAAIVSLVAPAAFAATSSAPPPTGSTTPGLFFVPAGSTITVSDVSLGNGAGDALAYGYRIAQSTRTQQATSPGGGGTYPEPSFSLGGAGSQAFLFELYLFDNTGKPTGESDENFYFYSSNPKHADVIDNGGGSYSVYLRDDGGDGADANTATSVGPGVQNFSATVTITP